MTFPQAAGEARSRGRTPSRDAPPQASRAAALEGAHGRVHEHGGGRRRRAVPGGQDSRLLVVLVRPYVHAGVSFMPPRRSSCVFHSSLRSVQEPSPSYVPEWVELDTLVIRRTSSVCGTSPRAPKATRTSQKKLSHCGGARTTLGGGNSDNESGKEGGRNTANGTNCWCAIYSTSPG